MPAAVFETALKWAIGRFAERIERGKLYDIRRRAWKNRLKVDAEYTGGTNQRRKLYGDFRASGLNVMPPMVTAPTMARLSRLLDE